MNLYKKVHVRASETIAKFSGYSPIFPNVPEETLFAEIAKFFYMSVDEVKLQE